MSNEQKVKILTEKEKKEIIQKRYSKDEFLKLIIDKTVQKMESSPYCRRILEGANYYTEGRPHNFDRTGFYLEDIYVGKPSWGPSGHCTKEKYQLETNDEQYNATRDAVYINEESMRQYVIDSTKKLNINIALDEEISEDTAFEEFCCNSTSFKEYYEKGMLKDHILALYNYHKHQDKIKELANDKVFIDYMSDVMLNIIAHECAHANQMNCGQQWGAQDSCALTLEGDERQEYIAKIASSKKISDYRAQVSGRSTDTVAEAGVMAHSYVAMLLTVKDERAVEYINNLMYKDRCELNTVNPNTEQMKTTDSSGNYTPEAIEEQQRVARAIFTSVCEKFGKQHMEKAKQHSGAMITPQVDYNGDATFEVILSSYQEHIFGSIDDYIKAIPYPGLSIERKEDLKRKVNQRDNNPKEIDTSAPKLSKQAKQTKEDMKRVKRVKESFDRVRNKFAKDDKKTTASSSCYMQPARSPDMEM